MSNERDLTVSRVRDVLARAGLTVVDEDLGRAWGGFLVVSPSQRERFVEVFFADAGVTSDDVSLPITPKILLVAPGQRLSWQYHARRSEIWRVLDGPVGVAMSQDDVEGDVQRFESGDVVRLECGVRHRLVGLDGWGTVAEIWQHTDALLPSDERDIVRVSDDYGRAGI